MQSFSVSTINESFDSWISSSPPLKPNPKPNPRMIAETKPTAIPILNIFLISEFLVQKSQFQSLQMDQFDEIEHK